MSIKNNLIVIKLKNLYPDDPVDRLRGINIVCELQKRGWNIELYTAQKEVDIILFLDSLHIDRKINAGYTILDIQDNHLNPRNSATLFVKEHIHMTLLDKIRKELQKGFPPFMYKAFTKLLHRDRYIRDIQNADLLICSSMALKEDYGKQNPNTYYIPDAVEVYADKDELPQADKEEVSLCWVGTANNIVYLKIVNDILQKLQQKYRVTFSLISSKQIFHDKALNAVLEDFGFDFTFIEWEKETVSAIIKQHDIAIAPLPDGAQKSTNKILTYMALRVATVCSGAKDYEALYNLHKESFCFVENSDEAWFEALQHLITDKISRKRIAENGYLLSGDFSLEQVANQYEQLFMEILKKGEGVD